MKRWLALSPPIALFLVISLVLLVCPGTEYWHESRPFRLLPHILLAIAFLLGLVFRQGRVLFSALLLEAVLFSAGRACSSGPDPARCAAVILLSSLYVPILAATLRHLRESGVFNSQGAGRAALVGTAAAMILILPEVKCFGRGLMESDLALLKPVSAILAIPGMGLVAFLVAIPIVFTRREHENPSTGILLCAAMLFVMLALNFNSVIWHPGQAMAVLPAFMSGAALVLAWSVIENLWHEAYVDELTELPGRRSLKHHLADLGESYVIAVLDMDHFKKINDKYGHDTGDQVLRFIAARLKDNSIGKAYRYGGEEFVIIAEKRPFENIVKELDEFRRSIADSKFAIRRKHRPRKKPQEPQPAPDTARTENITVTISIGAANHSTRNPTPADVMEAADEALYRAKEDGRNRVHAAR